MKKFCIGVAMSLAVCTGHVAAAPMHQQTEQAVQLTDDQKVALVNSVVQLAASPNKDQTPGAPKNATPTAEDVDKWASVGEKLGKSIATVAREAGIAVNEFASSPVGKFSLFLIAWSVLGNSLLHVIGAVMIWVVGYFIVRQYTRITREEEISYDETKKNIFGNYPVKRILRGDASPDLCVGYWCMSLVVFFVGFIVFINF